MHAHQFLLDRILYADQEETCDKAKLRRFRVMLSLTSYAWIWTKRSWYMNGQIRNVMSTLRAHIGVLT